MADEYRISSADLGTIERNLSNLGGGIETLANALDQVNGKVEGVAQEVSNTQDKLTQLAEEFHAFLDADTRAKELQLAETRLVKVRQELDTVFGHYAEVRRHTVGILQASDVSVVRQDTIKLASEELMLNAPRYWLAPGLVALSAWLSDNRPLAENAMKEAVKRDDNKSSLYFALIARRGERRQASGAWLQRFFSLQDPTDLDRELVVLIDAVANGVFGREGRGFCAQQFDIWLKEISERVGFVEDQRDQWTKALSSKEPSLGAAEYPYLRKYATIWGQMDASLRGARLYKVLENYFTSIFAGEIKALTSLSDAVDEMLDKLVTDFDDEELPKRRDERMLSLLVEEAGDRPAAQRRFGAEKQAFEQKVTFTQLVTNAAMHPEVAGATKATQRFAIAMSRDWIVAALDDLTAKNRAGAPTDIPIKIDSWQGTTRDGADETDLLSSVDSHLRTEEAKRVATIVLKPINWAALVLGGVVGLYGLVTLNWFLLFVGLAGVGWYFYSKSQLDKSKGQVHQHFEDLRDATPKILKAVLAEVVDWQKDYAAADAQAEDLRKYLQSITTEQHLLTTFESGRAVLNK